MRRLVMIAILSCGYGAIAHGEGTAQQKPERRPLTAELGTLASDALPSTAETEKFYVVQDRAVGLANRVEVAVDAARNFNSNIYVRSYEAGVRAIYHASNRWFLDAGISKVYNELTDSGRHAWANDGIYPDTSYVKQRWDVAVGFNAIYGKARMTQDTVFYFDQYVAIGGGQVTQDNSIEQSTTPALTGDVGLAVWLGRKISFRVGAKDYYFMERRVATQSKVNHLLGYGAVGVML
jgi:outer membrane beta-barrel protein